MSRHAQTCLAVLFVLAAVTCGGLGDDLAVRVDDGFGVGVLVPAGQFTMGDNYEEGNPRELPAHPVYVTSFYIGRCEVTNGEYLRFIEAGGYDNPYYWGAGGPGGITRPRYWSDASRNGGGIPGNEDFPVIGVSWLEASAYCAWVSEATGEIYRLPTEAEWEKAARGGDFLDGDALAQVPNPIDPPRRYPWGNEIDGSTCNYLDSGDPFDNGLTPVGYYDGSLRGEFQTADNASPYGAYDMSGNVYEWCSDYYSESYYRECLEAGVVENPTGPRYGSIHPIRGSAAQYETFKMRCAYRGAYRATARQPYIGFRWVREISEE